MNKQNSNWFFILWWALILALGLFFIGYFMFKSNMAQSPYGMANSITVNGEGKASVTPDMLVVNLSVSELAATTELAQTQSTEKINKVKDLLSGYIIPENNIKTTNVNVYPEYDWNDASGRKLLGYRSQQSLSINITGEKFGEVWWKIVTDVATIWGVNIDGTYFDLKDKNAALAGARQKALDDAKAKADQLVKASGRRLGKVLNITDNSYYNMPGPIYYGKAEGMWWVAMDTAATPSVSLSPWATEVTVNVNVVYRIK